jgi:outer membrane usher protein
MAKMHRALEPGPITLPCRAGKRFLPNTPFLAAAAVGLSSVMVGMPSSTAAEPARLAVSIVATAGDSIVLRMTSPAAFEPSIDLLHARHARGARLRMTWPARLSLERPLPDPQAKHKQGLCELALQARPGETELELTLAQPMRTMLRRIGDAWVLQLDPETPGECPAAPPLPSAPAATAPTRAPSSTPTLPGAHAAATPTVMPPAAPAPPAQPPGGAPEQLLMDVTVNGRALPDVVRAELVADKVLVLPVEAWTEARLTAPAQAVQMSDGTPAYRLDAIPGSRFSIDRQALRLAITVPAAALATARIGTGADRGPAPPRPRPGAVLNYDVAASAAGSGAPATATAVLEGVAFGGPGSFVSSALVRAGGPGPRVERLDTFWRHDMPDRMQTLVLGDTVGVAGGWSQPVRYAGLRWGRDFAMQPGFITMPTVALSAEAALPSTVDVLVNNARRASQPVPPGPFELTNVPVVTGAGEINVVVRDLLGNQTVIRQNYYASSQLLAPGLSDFSLEAGRLRFGYGTDSYYAGQFAAGTVRTGLTRNLTGELRVELQPRRRAAGVDLAGLLGSWAVAHGSVAQSQGSASKPGEHGTQVAFGLERSTPQGGASIEYQQAQAGFAPFGELEQAGASDLRPRQRLVTSVGGPLVRHLNGGIVYVRQTRWDGERLALAGLSLSAPLWAGASMNLSVTRELNDVRDWRGSLLMSIPLGAQEHMYARVERDGPDGQFGTLAVSHPAPAGNGMGWDVEASTQASQHARAAVKYNTDWSEMDAQLATNPQGGVAARAGARGSIGFLADQPFASRPIGEGSFAVVEVGGLPGVPVLRSHQVVATTNRNGTAFVPGLLPWQQNQIEIDPTELPLDAQVDDLVRQVTPFPASGTVVNFAVKRSRQALLVLRQADGRPVPVGTRVRVVPDGPEFIGGLRGEIWLSDLPPGRAQVEASWPNGACTLELPAAAAESTQQQIGPLTCGDKTR